MTKYTNRHTRIDTRKKLKHHSTERQPMFSTMAAIINFNCYLSSNGLLVAETDIQVQHDQFHFDGSNLLAAAKDTDYYDGSFSHSARMLVRTKNPIVLPANENRTTRRLICTERETSVQWFGAGGAASGAEDLR